MTERRSTPLPWTSPQGGFSMIEVLVSIVVMAFGLLGISGLIVNSVNNATQTELASRANQAANEIMDAMRANTVSSAANYLVNFGQNPLTFTSPSATAQAEIRNWLQSVKQLPNGDGQITTATGSTTEYVISIRFNNCLGTLSGAEKTACVSDAATVRTITFNFRP